MYAICMVVSIEFMVVGMDDAEMVVVVISSLLISDVSCLFGYTFLS